MIPEDTQELLLLVIKALSSYIVKKPEPVPIIVQPAMTMALAAPPPNSDMSAAQSDSAPANGNGRRLTTIATNPYTGLMHYVYYPTYYPMVL